MPIYEYQCTKCGHEFEKMQGYSDPEPACPTCGGKVKQLLSAPAVQFKGSGWYVTDYAKKSSAPASKSESKAESKSESKSDSKAADKKSDSTNKSSKKD